MGSHTSRVTRNRQRLAAGWVALAGALVVLALGAYAIWGPRYDARRTAHPSPVVTRTVTVVVTRNNGTKVERITTVTQGAPRPEPGPIITRTQPGVPGATVTVPGPGAPGPTVTVPGPTVTEPGPTEPGPTVTVTQPGPTVTVTQPGPTVTETVTPAPTGT